MTVGIGPIRFERMVLGGGPYPRNPPLRPTNGEQALGKLPNHMLCITGEHLNFQAQNQSIRSVRPETHVIPDQNI
jgi:hypothetical protein